MKFSIRERFKAVYQIYLKDEKNLSDTVIAEGMQITVERLRDILNEKEFLNADEIAYLLLNHPMLNSKFLLLGWGIMKEMDENKPQTITNIHNNHSNNSGSNISDNNALIDSQKNYCESIISAKDEVIIYRDKSIDFLRKEIEKKDLELEHYKKSTKYLKDQVSGLKLENMELKNKLELIKRN